LTSRGYVSPAIAQGPSFDMMIVPEAANMPPTPWQTEILASGIWAGAMPAHLAHALLQRTHAVRAGMHVGKAAAIGPIGDHPRGGVTVSLVSWLCIASGAKSGPLGQQTAPNSSTVT
jgi:hypothetical protein